MTRAIATTGSIDSSTAIDSEFSLTSMSWDPEKTRDIAIFSEAAQFVRSASPNRPHSDVHIRRVDKDVHDFEGQEIDLIPRRARTFADDDEDNDNSYDHDYMYRPFMRRSRHGQRKYKRVFWPQEAQSVSQITTSREKSERGQGDIRAEDRPKTRSKERRTHERTAQSHTQAARDADRDVDKRTKPERGETDSAAMPGVPDSSELATALFSKPSRQSTEVEAMAEKMREHMRDDEVADIDEKQRYEHK